MELKQVQPKWTIIQNRKVSNAHFFIKYTYFQGIKFTFNSPYVRDQEKGLNNRQN